jgi:hypothetical protein
MIPLPEPVEIFVSTLICFAIGTLWLSPALFGKAWLRIINVSDSDYSRYINGTTYVWFAALLVALNIGIHALVNLLGFTTMNEGIYFGIGLWTLIVVPSFGIVIMFERRQLLLFAIYTSYFLVIFVISSVLYAMWR